jgi:hypothetical protein
MRSPLIVACLAPSWLVFSGGAAVADVVINEIMYNSPGTDIEFIELHNAGASPVNLSNWYLLDDDPAHPHCLLVGTLAAGAFLVVAGDIDLFMAQYPWVTNLNPFDFDPNGTGFGLGNEGDTIHLYTAAGVQVDVVPYDDENNWPGAADGDGPTLELIYPLLDNAQADSWAASLMAWGTPGEQNSAYQVDQTPICRDGERNIALPTSSDVVLIRVTAFDNEDLSTVQLWVDTGAGYSPRTMYDDGLHGDGAVGDSLWGAVIDSQPNGTLVRYYTVVTDDIGQMDYWPGGAPVEYRAYTVGHTPPDLRITEVVPRNVTGIIDEFAQHEDWVEIYNPNAFPVDLGGMFLSDESARSHMWMLPDFELGSQEYLIVWADGDLIQGNLHADFNLAAAGEYIGLFDTEDHGNALIDGFEFGPAGPDIAVGFKPADGNFPEYLAVPTPGAANGSSPLYSGICLNEFMTTSVNGGIDDWIEIYNRGNGTVSLAGWLLSDDRAAPGKYVFPPSASLDPGEHLVIYENVLGFGFSSSGTEDIVLTLPDSTTGMDFYDMLPQHPDTSTGRYPDGLAYWHLLHRLTPGEANAAPIDAGEGAPLVSGLRLAGGFPNPFNPRTTLLFELGKPSEVSLRVYDAAGRMVRELFQGRLPAGQHVHDWNGRDGEGRTLASGVYFVRAATADGADQAKLVLIK